MAELADALDSGSSVRNGRGGSNPLTRTYISTSPKGLSAIRRESFFCGWSRLTAFVSWSWGWPIVSSARCQGNLDAPMMETEHIHEAVNYRLLDRRYWNR